MSLSSGEAIELACILEATAEKAGNVHRYRDFSDTSYLDFVLSATALRNVFDRALHLSLGELILLAVEQTRSLVGRNTNLGIILTIAPLAKCPPETEWVSAVSGVLRATTVGDAELMYRAIRHARPGGMGEATNQDLSEQPTENLTDTMCHAADRDLIAKQYATGYEDLLQGVVPQLRINLTSGLEWGDAIVKSHLQLISDHGDSLIARKNGVEMSQTCQRKAQKVLESGWPGSASGRAAFTGFDAWLREDGNKRNPGTTADLIAAGLFVLLRDGTFSFPIESC